MLSEPIIFVVSELKFGINLSNLVINYLQILHSQLLPDTFALFKHLSGHPVILIFGQKFLAIFEEHIEEFLAQIPPEPYHLPGRELHERLEHLAHKVLLLKLLGHQILAYTHNELLLLLFYDSALKTLIFTDVTI